MPMVAMVPYYAVTILHMIPEEGSPRKQVGEGAYPILEYLGFVLIPEYYFYTHREEIFGGLPGFIPYQLILLGVCKFIILIMAALYGTLLDDAKVENGGGECIHAKLR